MKITYMKESVEIPTLLKAHKITMSQLREYAHNSKDGSFTIDGNRYKLPKDKKTKRNARTFYSVTKKGMEAKTGLKAEEVAKMLNRCVSSISNATIKGDPYRCEGWCVVRE